MIYDKDQYLLPYKEDIDARREYALKLFDGMAEGGSLSDYAVVV